MALLTPISARASYVLSASSSVLIPATRFPDLPGVIQVEVTNLGIVLCTLDVQTSVDNTRFASLNIAELVSLAVGTTQIGYTPKRANRGDWFRITGSTAGGAGLVEVAVHYRGE